MKILIVGNGGREHALLAKLRQDAPAAEFYITLGNGGTGSIATAIPIEPTEIQALAGWALKENIDLTVVGPEVPLAEGIVDHFSAQGLRIFGPTRAAAELESSKAFAKGLMKQYGIPTAAFEIFTEAEPAIAFVRERGAPIVVKASGLAAGKGAIVCQTEHEAIQAVRNIFAGGFGEAGDKVVIEEFMTGEELSVFAICDGENALRLMAAQDHKRIGEGDSGPNTGGMGAYAPVSIATDELLSTIDRGILGPTMRAMASEGRPYRGFLYAGLMLTPDGPKVVEFNCRFGDPEAQVVLPLMKSSLLQLIEGVARGRPLDGTSPVAWRPLSAVTTVLASGGYPGSYSTGHPIEIPDGLGESEHVRIFHAGTRRENGQLVTSGGRVLAVTALGGSVKEAARRSREAAEQISFEGRVYRRDIGWREFGRG